MQQRLNELLDAPLTIVQQSKVAGLWAGYGSVTAVQVKHNAPRANKPSLNAPLDIGSAGRDHLIIKEVNPPSSSGVESSPRRL